MIPRRLNDWFAAGTVNLDGHIDVHTPPSETIQIAIGVASEIEKWGEDIAPAIYVPDGVTESSANFHGRVIIVVYKLGHLPGTNAMPAHFRLGSIIFENGTASVNVSKLSVYNDEQCYLDEENVGKFDLSDPDFPATIFKPFQQVLVQL